MQWGAVVLLVITAGCVDASSIECEVGTEFARTCPADSSCDDVHHLCVGQDQLKACENRDDGMECSVGDIAGLCRDHVCFEKACGDGFIRDDEDCEGDDLGGAVDCQSIGYYEPSPLTCTRTCAYDRTQCLGFCGDGIVTAGHEQCDGANLGGAIDCQSIGYYEPSPLSCTIGCAFDESQCLGYCGDGILTPGHEFCDGAPPAETCESLGFIAGYLDCKFCAPDLDACTFSDWHEPIGLTLQLFDIDGAGDDQVYAVSAGGTLFRFDGSAWVTVDLSSCGAGTVAFTSVRALGTNDVIGAGVEASKTTIVHLTGTTCTKLLVDIGGGPVMGLVRDMWATSATDIWVIIGTTLYRYNGVTWSTSVTGLPNNYIWASGPSDAYAVSMSAAKHWDGMSWTTVAFPTTSFGMDIYAVYGTSATDVYIAGGTNQGFIQAMHYDGSWNVLAPEKTFDGRIVSMSKTGQSLFAATEGGPVYVHDGASWAAISSPYYIDTPRIYASQSGKAFAIDQATGQAFRFSGTYRTKIETYAGYGRRVFAHSSGAVYTFDSTTMWLWDGVAWTSEVRPNLIGDIWVDSTGTLFALQASTGLVKRTGANTYATVDATAFGSRMWGFSANDIWIANNTSVVHYTGAPASACGTCTATQPIADLWGADPNNLWSVGNGGEIRYYTNGSWMTQPIGTGVNLKAVWGWAANDVVAVGLGLVLHYNGQSWQSLDYPFSHDLIDVWGTSLSDLFVASSDGRLYRYDGAHWSPVDSDARPALNAITGSGDSMFWFGGAPAGVTRVVRTTDW